MKLVGGVNFCVEKEQNIQILEIGIESTIYDDIFPRQISKGWLDGISKNFRNCFRTNDMKGDIGMSILRVSLCKLIIKILGWLDAPFYCCRCIISNLEEHNNNGYVTKNKDNVVEKF